MAGGAAIRKPWLPAGPAGWQYQALRSVVRLDDAVD
jgi:hypothetical protein